MRFACAIVVAAAAVSTCGPTVAATIDLSWDGYRILLESDRLSGPSARTMTAGRILDAKSACTVRSESGRSLRLDGHTTTGRYVTENGFVIELESPLGYPRRFSSGELVRWVDFIIGASKSTTRFGVLITSGLRPGTRTEFLNAIRMSSKGGPIDDDDDFLAIELPDSARKHGALELSTRRTEPLRVTWFAWEPGRTPRSLFEYGRGFCGHDAVNEREDVSICARLNWKSADREESLDPPTAMRIPVEDADLRLRVIGAVLIDPHDGSIRDVGN